MRKWDLWERFVGAIEKAQAELEFQKDEECFYRGHSDSSWPLLPTLHRVTLPAKPGTKKEAQLRRNLEHDLFFEFQARARELHTMNLSQWDILFFMRHHGVPTRLLDWTESLGVALFFALDGYRSGRTPCIWLLNPYLLNEEGLGDRDLYTPKFLGYDTEEDYYYDYDELLADDCIDWESPVAIYPAQKSARMGAQRGWFTIQGNDPDPLEKACSKAVRRVDIPIGVMPTASELLQTMGLDRYLLFQDLDGLGDALKDKYEIQFRNHRSPAHEKRTLDGQKNKQPSTRKTHRKS